MKYYSFRLKKERKISVTLSDYMIPTTIANRYG